MLTINSVRAANDLARRFLSTGISILPKRGTLMDELQLAACGSVSAYVPYSKERIVAAVAMSNGPGAGNPATEETRHDVIMDSYIDDLAALAASHVMFNKSVVNKAVGAFRDTLVATYNGFKAPTPEEVFDVSYHELAEVFSSEDLLSEIESGAGYGYSSLQPYDHLAIAKLDRETCPLETYLLTGDATFDAFISSWIATVGKERLASYIFSGIDSDHLSIEVAVDHNLANYLFYRNLSIRLDLNFGLTLTQLRVKAVANKNAWCGFLKSSIEDYNRSVRNGLILTPGSDVRFRDPVGSEKLSVTVLLPSFNKFIEAGGSIECIFGYIAEEGSTSKTYQELLGNQERYLSTWKSVRTMYLIRANNNRLDSFKRAINLAYDAVNCELEDGELEARTSQPGYQDKVARALDSYIDSLTVASIDDVDEVSIAVIAGVRFYYTNAFVYLTEMYRILKMSPEASVEEASLFAAIPYITEYVMGQTYILR